MPIKAKHVVAAKTEAIKKKIAEGKGQPQKEWRVEGHEGVVLVTRPTGSGVFYFFYRPEHGGKQHKLRLGEFPALPLAEATRMALEHRLQVEKGANPAVEKAILRASMTFQALAEKFLAEGPSSATTKQTYTWALKKDVYPAFGAKPAVAVSAEDVADVCRKIKSRGSLVQAQRTKTAIGGIYEWGRSNFLVKINPAKLVPNQLDAKSKRTRTPTSAELAALWTAVDQPSRLTKAMRILVKLAILTGQRRKEVAGAMVAEVNGLNTPSPTWVIAASVVKAGRVVTEGRMKNKSQQRVYLSRQAAALFDDAIKTCGDGVHLFPADSQIGGKTRLPYLHGESVTKAMARLCEAAKVTDLTIHDMRRAIGNFLKDNGIGREVRDLILHHKDASVDGQHYSSSATMEAQCRAAWQLWADHVSSLTAASAPTSALNPSTAVTAAP